MRHSVCFLPLACLLAAVCSCGSDRTGGSPGGIMEWKERNIDLGQFPRSESRQAVFRFVNAGDRMLVIHEVEPSCGCMTADYTAKPVAPGDSGTVTVSYSGVTQQVGHFDKHLTVISSDTTQYNIIRISGETYEGETSEAAQDERHTDL